MVVIPCSCATLGKLAHGIGDNLVQGWEVFFKEKRTLILVPRETPLLPHPDQELELLCLAGRISSRRTHPSMATLRRSKRSPTRSWRGCTTIWGFLSISPNVGGQKLTDRI
jgi:hypothetical protein